MTQKDLIKSVADEKLRPMKLHVLIEKEDDLFTAHCLEFDVVAEGNSMMEAKRNIVKSIESYISFAFENNLIKTMFSSAPSEDWYKFFKSEKLKSLKKVDLVAPSYQGNLLSNFAKEVGFGKAYA